MARSLDFGHEVNNNVQHSLVRVDVMVIRLFLVLLALNLLAFAVHANAAEPLLDDRMMAERDGRMSPEEMAELQEWMSGESDDERTEAVAAIGSRLLSLTLSNDQRRGRSYASDPAEPDHGIGLLNEGASLNLRWKF